MQYSHEASTGLVISTITIIRSIRHQKHTFLGNLSYSSLMFGQCSIDTSELS